MTSGSGVVSDYIVDTLLHCSKSSSKGSRPVPVKEGEKGTMHVVPVSMGLLKGISTLRVTVPPDLRPPEARQQLADTLVAAVTRLGGASKVPRLDPVDDMNIQEDEVKQLVEQIGSLRSKLEASPVHEPAMDGRLREVLER